MSVCGHHTGFTSEARESAIVEQACNECQLSVGRARAKVEMVAGSQCAILDDGEHLDCVISVKVLGCGGEVDPVDLLLGLKPPEAAGTLGSIELEERLAREPALDSARERS